LDGDQNNVVRSNGGGFSKYTMIPPPMNGYDQYLLQSDHHQRSQGFLYDHRIARAASVSASSTTINPYFNEATNHTVLSIVHLLILIYRYICI